MWRCSMDPGPGYVPSGYGDDGQPLRDFDHDLRGTLVTYIEVGVVWNMPCDVVKGQ